MQELSNVWELENPDEQAACDCINYLYEQARKGKVSARNILKKCFADKWDTIKERMEAEGSIWYVWYMDGVRNYLNLQN